MNQDITVIRALSSIESECKYKLTFIQLQCIRNHLYLIYGAGFDEGRKVGKGAKPVVKIKNGVILQEYPSTQNAGNAMKVGASSIQKAARGDRGEKSTCKGFKWKYTEDL